VPRQAPLLRIRRDRAACRPPRAAPAWCRTAARRPRRGGRSEARHTTAAGEDARTFVRVRAVRPYAGLLPRVGVPTARGAPAPLAQRPVLGDGQATSLTLHSHRP